MAFAQHIIDERRQSESLRAHQKLVELSGPEMAVQYTDLIKDRQLYEGACELSWPRYFEYRDAHPDECAPLTNADLVYVGQWTSAAPAPIDVTEDKPRTPLPNLAITELPPSVASADSFKTKTIRSTVADPHYRKPFESKADEQRAVKISDKLQKLEWIVAELVDAVSGHEHALPATFEIEIHAAVGHLLSLTGTLAWSR